MSTPVPAETAVQSATPVQNESKFYSYGSVSGAYKSSESFFAGVAKAVVEAVANVFKAIANAALTVYHYFKGSPQVDSSEPKSVPASETTEQELPDLVIVDGGAPAKAASTKFSKKFKAAVGLGTAVAALGIAHYLGYTQPADFVASGFNSAKNLVSYAGYHGFGLGSYN